MRSRQKRSLHAVIFVAVACCAIVANAQAHLLNMSRVHLSFNDAAIEAQLELDLTRAFGSSAEFHRASILTEPLRDQRVDEQLRSMITSIELEIGGLPVDWSVERVAFESSTLADYESMLVWPRATVVLRGRLATDLTPNAAVSDRPNKILHLVFRPTFPFEEPIATTVSAELGDRSQQSMTRWLVANQRFPQPNMRLATRLQQLSGGSRFGVQVDEYASSTSEWLTTAATFFRNGFLHVLPNGWDHLAFVLGLLLLATTLRSAITLLLAYTLGHTLSYAALVLRWIPLPGPWAEVVILLSIAWVGVTIMLNRRRHHGRLALTRYVAVLAFGTVHGLGFAAGLGPLPVQTIDFLAAIIGFNLGVEAAQILTALVLAIAIQWRINGQSLHKHYQTHLAALLVALPLLVQAYRWLPFAN